jgi:hypothetical protein
MPKPELMLSWHTDYRPWARRFQLTVAIRSMTESLWLAMAGASIKEIQELAGHKTITMSARYSHL